MRSIYHVSEINLFLVHILDLRLSVVCAAVPEAPYQYANKANIKACTGLLNALFTIMVTHPQNIYTDQRLPCNVQNISIDEPVLSSGHNGISDHIKYKLLI